MNEYKQRYENRVVCGTTEVKHGTRRKMWLIYTASAYIANNGTRIRVFALFIFFGIYFQQNILI